MCFEARCRKKSTPIASISESGIDTMGSDKDHSHILLNYKPKTSIS
ncbi:MAG: transposase [Sphaerochaeta sp.]|nr:transposase [Sphaerochaeta sp.]